MSSVGTAACIPNAALRRLEFVIGEWRTTGSHPQVPGKTFHGRTSFAWHQGGAFVIMHSEIDEREIPSGVALIGTDDEAGTAFMMYFDERGVSRKYDVEIGERRFTLSRDSRKLAQRMTITADAGGSVLRWTGTMSENDGPWTRDLSLVFERL